MLDAAIEHLQIKMAFLERANSELSDVILRQQREIEALGARLRELAERVEANQSEERSRSLDDERPPHY